MLAFSIKEPLKEDMIEIKMSKEFGNGWKIQYWYCKKDGCQQPISLDLVGFDLSIAFRQER